MRPTALRLLLQLAVCSALTLLPALATAEPQRDEFTVAVAQVEISEELYSSAAEFGTMVREAVEAAAERDADLVVFPEYLNVFLATTPYFDIVHRSSSVEGALRRMAGNDDVPDTPQQLFVEQGDRVRAIMDRIYGELARREQLHILAGSYFAADPAGAQDPAATLPEETIAREEVRLTNRSVLYGPDGKVIHEQDKVYLTDFERDLIGLDAGDLTAVGPAMVEGLEIGITICRDLFFPVWERVHWQRDLWVDLRAEGTQWQQGREDFTEVLPQRIVASDSGGGVTAALTGTYLDLFWEGKSAVITRDEGRPEFAAVAESASGAEVLVVTLQFDREE